ncbi:MAG TPA: hypothetical protein RMH99_17595 [Sandaracinaceae bacterium LLY-WYZ-13_1]|nr:hypothetical protein [Sandaracinaceae bacterium LLY-WYZ-13_1]
MRASILAHSVPAHSVPAHSVLGLALLALALLGCGDDEPEPSAATESDDDATEAADEGPAMELIAGGVTWTAEEPFVLTRPDNDMRAAEYEIRDHPGAVLTVAHFPMSEGGGGDVQENVDRWTGQFEDASEPRVERREVQDLPVTTVDVRGTFVGRRGMGTRSPPRPGWRLLGAIVEGEQGLVFFKLLGPEDGVGIAADAFERLVASIHPV